jgi:hypothetical protein
MVETYLLSRKRQMVAYKGSLILEHHFYLVNIRGKHSLAGIGQNAARLLRLCVSPG